MKNTVSVIALFLFTALLALPASAGFIGHTINGSAVQGGPNLFIPDSVVIANTEYDEYGDPITPPEFEAMGIVGWLDGEIGNEDKKLDITIMADFYEDIIHGSVLDMRVFRSEGSGGNFTISGLTLTFTNLNYLDLPDDDYLLESVNAIPFEYDPADFGEGELPPGYHATLQGLTLSHVSYAPIFTIAFSNFQVSDEGRGDRFQLAYALEDTAHPPETVVPVPAAAPMALLGLGMLALARRFRRTKS